MKGIKKSLPYILIISIIVGDIILYVGLTKMFFETDETLTAGVMSLIGAVIGGSLTLIGVKWTLESQMQRENEKKKEELRTYLSTSIISFNFEKDNNIGRKEKHRIILTDSFKSLVGALKEIPYYSIVRYGGSDIVTNCHFRITVGSDETFKNIDVINVWIDFFEKDEELLIPVCSSKLKMDKPWIKGIHATFYTAQNDKVEFEQSEINNTRKQNFYDGGSVYSIDFKTEYTAWTQKTK